MTTVKWCPSSPRPPLPRYTATYQRLTPPDFIILV